MNDTVENARKLRRDQTDAEKLLWSKLRNRQFENLKFRRQHPIPPYIADFFCEEVKLVIEVDGGQHSPKEDQKRQNYIESKGFQVLRFWNNDVLSNVDGVLENIKLNIPSPKPSPQGEGLICIGKIASAHGVKGLVKILPFGDDPALLEQVKDYKITIKSSTGKHLLAEIEGVSDRDAAEALKNTELFIARDKLPEIKDENTFYYEDLIGLPCSDESGSEIGKVLSVQNYGAGELLEVRLKSGQDVLVPFTDDYVPDVGESVTIRNYESLMV